ncbi:MAG: hypothetical protein ACE5FL_06270 [Myxococcota bacterium]
MSDDRPDSAAVTQQDHGRRHLLIGWWALLIFLTAGMTLEILMGFRIGLYLDVDNETRRLMWRLAHSHGALLAVVNVAFGLTCTVLAEGRLPRARLVSPFLIAATVLLPGGFFLGGVAFHGADPGAGVLLSPLGSLALFVAVLLISRDLLAGTTADPEATAPTPAE